MFEMLDRTQEAAIMGMTNRIFVLRLKGELARKKN